MATATVRPASPEDVTEIVRIQRETWRVAYADLLPAHALSELDTQGTELSWRQAIEHGPAKVFVATEGEWTVGFCAAGPAPESESANANGTLPADAAHTVLISALLVEPRWARRGHGGRLLGTAVGKLRAEGHSRAIAWVAQEDEATLGFYRSVGWQPDGTVRTLDTGARLLRELRLTGTLRPSLED